VRKMVAIVVLVLALVGYCGVHSNSGDVVPHASDVADRVGCTAVPTQTPSTTLVAEQATCTSNGVEITIYTIATSSDQYDWMLGFSAAGMINHVIETLIIVDAANSDTMSRVASALRRP
jgi:hypothetical protein